MIPDYSKSRRPSVAAVLPPGWHFVRNGRLVLVAEAIDTGEWPVSIAPGADPLCWVRATCKVSDLGAAAFAVADLPTAIVQQLRVAVRAAASAVRAAASGEAELAPEKIAGAVCETVDPVFRRWGVSIQEVTVTDAMS